MQEHITVDGKKIVLVGTVHVSPESVQEVRQAIEEEAPDTVGVELCERRYEIITKKKQWEEQDIVKIIKKGQTYLFLANLLLSNFQKKMGEEVGSEPGAEMVEAVKIAKEHDMPVELLDRDISVTLKRAWNAMGFKEKLKLVYVLLSGFFVDTEEVLEELKNQDIVTELMEELAQQAPGAKKALIDERDQYIASKILESRGDIVAVVGAGHLQGIKSTLQQKEVSREGLESAPSGRSWFKMIGYLIPVIFAVIVGYSFLRGGVDVTLRLLWMWFLINGTLSALGAALALGHPLSVGTAFLVAPFTSLNPTLAAGWFAGLVEAYLRKPTVASFEALRDVRSFKDFYKNRVTRILLVIAFSNIGSTIGTVWALPYMAQLLG
ncbi:MAG: TraB/GumN family protein [Theionarchaea archaeon]|nr:TraB/GumN family protein [Theionarchaea archaeon]MBU6999262.1 TraB/GumN family protein [Theionarchaea archaeon]MBU7019613.1 TraB/GumN family protein [Theionarchaea archaeon]MBU7033792.1 TraB/GumN family protein [Theionarchaea archaeon]MBU7040202.1 TraB/GumN family protein [Theionarchaea archaeon]